MRYHVREMQLDEANSIIRHYLDADLGFLNRMGVDPENLPSESTWFDWLDFARPIEQKRFYYLVW